MPEFKVPEFKVPEFKVPEFDVPEFDVPEFEVQATLFPFGMRVVVTLPCLYPTDFATALFGLPEGRVGF